jgi:polysaccharide export outer membrane protein
MREMLQGLPRRWRATKSLGDVTDGTKEYRVADWKRTAMTSLLVAVLAGCSGKAFINPSIRDAYRGGRTPTALPVLTRIAAIEDDTGELVEYSDPTPGDLVPQPMLYRIGPGDSLRITTYDLIEPGRSELHEVEVDARGMIEIPQLGRIAVGGKTSEEATEAVQAAMRRLIADPLAAVQVVAQRQQTFNLIGAVDKPGPYFIPRPNYRLLEAISAGGRFDENAEYVYVIREVSLAEEAPPTPTPSEKQEPPRNILDIIDEIAPPKPQPGLFAPRNQPEAPRAPVVTLPEDEPVRQPRPAQTPPSGATRWVFLNGRWTQVVAAPKREGADGLPEPEPSLITQRVIRVPMKELIAGRQSVNVIIRPGDVVRIPSAPVGTFYIGGQVARPGTFALPSTGGLTLLRAIQAAGGYAELATPARIEVTRVIAKDREATIMLDGAAIANRTQPDIYIKPNDNIYVGTTTWAYPLAVLRNGFRVNYGWGFVLDRNLSNDLLGPPPVNAFGQ